MVKSSGPKRSEPVCRSIDPEIQEILEMRAFKLVGCIAAACVSMSAVAEDNMAFSQQQILPGIRMRGPGDAEETADLASIDD